MSPLIIAHVATGLTGIVAGLVSVAGLLRARRLPICNFLFLSMTAAACLTGFFWLPAAGVTSAQLVAFFLVFLLALAAYARYVRGLSRNWVQVYALASVGALFLNVLITTAQSFLHVAVLKSWAPTQHSPIYITVKIALLVLFAAAAFFTAYRAKPPGN